MKSGVIMNACAGAGPNGAIIHYRAEPSTSGTVDNDTLLLVDSGKPITEGAVVEARKSCPITKTVAWAAV